MSRKKGKLRIFKRSKFSLGAYARDKKGIIAKYNSIGLRDAAIAKDTFYLIDDKNLVVEIQIEEGDKYYFGDMTWVGNSKYRTSFLDTVLEFEIW